MFSLDYLASLIAQYKYYILLPLMIIEGPIATVIAAFLSALNILNIYIVYALAVAGDVIGDIVYYLIGRLGRHSIIPRYGQHLGITEEKISYAEKHYKKHLKKTIFWGKVTQAPVLVVLVTAGIAKVDFKKFLLTVFFITLIKALVFSIIGFYFGRSYYLINKYLDRSIMAVWIAILSAILLYWIYLRYKNSKKTE